MSQSASEATIPHLSLPAMTTLDATLRRIIAAWCRRSGAWTAMRRDGFRSACGPRFSVTPVDPDRAGVHPRRPADGADRQQPPNAGRRAPGDAFRPGRRIRALAGLESPHARALSPAEHRRRVPGPASRAPRHRNRPGRRPRGSARIRPEPVVHDCTIKRGEDPMPPQPRAQAARIVAAGHAKSPCRSPSAAFATRSIAPSASSVSGFAPSSEDSSVVSQAQAA